ncbi:MAG: hypothetical protein HY400_03400 [Elusimicrobia bacterium]|nr:hypothetical protein [Elusimicrobiota bacterium]
MKKMVIGSWWLVVGFLLTSNYYLLTTVLYARLTGGPWVLPSHSFSSGGGGLTQTQTGTVSLRNSLPVDPGVGLLQGGGYTLQGGQLAQALVKYAALDLGQAHAYPVPWRQSLHTGNPITFTNLTQDSRVKIYTLSGELVKTLEKSNPGSNLVWDITNDEGEKVFSGVYHFLLEDTTTGQKKKGKLMVIR